MRPTRLTRLTLSSALFLLAAGAPALLPALETPLILPAKNIAGVIDPGLGTLTTIEVQSNGTQRKSFVNWLMDVDQLQRRSVEQNGETFTDLRTGSKTVLPTPEEFTQFYPDQPTKKQTDNGQKDLRTQVRAAEKVFWEQEHPYDGIVRGAFTGQYLMLVIPATRAVLFYQNNGKDTVERIGYTNYSPLLYLGTAWKSMPDPAQLVQSLKLDEAEKKALEGALAAREDGSAPQAAKSDIWCTAVGEGFVVVDSANKKIWAYEVKGVTVALTSVRNMAVDLMAPGFQTLPLDQQGIELFGKQNAGALKAIGVDKLDGPYVQAFIHAQQVGDSAKAGALQANQINNQVLLNFTAERKLVAYEYRQGAGLALTSVRDTTVDLGLMLLARQINEMSMARKSYNEAVALGAKNPTGALRLITYALGLDPALHADAEKNSNLKNALKADWEKLKLDAVKAEDERKAKRETIIKAAEAERKRLAEKKKG